MHLAERLSNETRRRLALWVCKGDSLKARTDNLPRDMKLRNALAPIELHTRERERTRRWWWRWICAMIGSSRGKWIKLNWMLLWFARTTARLFIQKRPSEESERCWLFTHDDNLIHFKLQLYESIRSRISWALAQLNGYFGKLENCLPPGVGPSRFSLH